MKNKSVEQIHIENLSLKREEYYKLYEDSWDEEAEKYSMEEPKEIDELGDEILKYIISWQHALPVEFILEELDKLGWAPCLLNNDNGEWLVTGDAMEEISTENEFKCIAITHFTQDKKWYSTIRGAIQAYLTEE